MDAQATIDRSEAALDGAELDDKHDTQVAPEHTGWDINDDAVDSKGGFAGALETLQTESVNYSEAIEINIGRGAHNRPPVKEHSAHAPGAD